MSTTIDTLKEVFWYLWKGALEIGLFILTFAFLPNQSLFTLILCNLAWYYIFNLWAENPSSWDTLLYKPAITTLYLFIIYLLWSWAGILGVLGSIVLLIGMAAFQIHKNWRLFDGLTTWGALRISGKTKDAFNLNEVLEHEKGRTTKQDGRSDNTREEKEDPRGSSFDVQSVQILQENVQERPSTQSSNGIDRKRIGAQTAVSDLPKPIRKRIKPRKKVEVEL